jgi:hypothetical protein
VLMGAIDRAVQALPLVINIRLQCLEQPLPLALLGPAIEPIEHRLPGTKPLWQLSPRHAGSTPPHNRFDEISVVSRWAASSSLARQEALHLSPLPVVHLNTQRHGLLQWSPLALYRHFSAHRFVADVTKYRDAP